MLFHLGCPLLTSILGSLTDDPLCVETGLCKEDGRLVW